MSSDEAHGCIRYSSQAYAIFNSDAISIASAYDAMTCSYARRDPIQSSTRAGDVWLYTSSQHAFVVRQSV